METVNGKICISHAELTGRIITTSNLNALVRKGQVNQVRKGGNGRTALYAVDSLPLKWRTEVYRRYPDLQERAESKEFVDTIEPDAKALDYFQTYKLADGRNLPEDKVLEYASNAAVMNAFRRCWEAHVSKRQRTGKKAVAAKEFWARAAAALPRLADSFPHSLPGSAPSANEISGVFAAGLCVLYLRQVSERQRRQGSRRGTGASADRSTGAPQQPPRHIGLRGLQHLCSSQGVEIHNRRSGGRMA